MLAYQTLLVIATIKKNAIRAFIVIWIALMRLDATTGALKELYADYSGEPELTTPITITPISLNFLSLF